MTPTEMAGIIAVLADALTDCVFVGKPAPLVQRLLDWMRQPLQPGDLVVEQSTRRRPPSTARVGIVLKTEDRKLCRHELDDPNLESCAGCPPDERHRELFTWIEILNPPCGNSTSCADLRCVHRHRWFNANFLRIPMTTRDLEALDRPGLNVTAGVVTRSDLIDALTDAGISLKDKQ